MIYKFMPWFTEGETLKLKEQQVDAEGLPPPMKKKKKKKRLTEQEETLENTSRIAYSDL